MKYLKTIYSPKIKIGSPDNYRDWQWQSFLLLFSAACFLLMANSNFIFAQDIVLLDSSALMNEITYTNLKEALEHPDKVYKLNLSKHKLIAFPEEIMQLKNLQVLNLSKNNIKEIPKEIGTLTHLQVLNISKNRLENIPQEIGKLTNLVSLDLGRNKIVDVPKEIGNLNQLELLDLWDNDISLIPDEIKNLTNLKVFELRGILFSDDEPARLKELLPNTKINLSPTCDCGN